MAKQHKDKCKFFIVYSAEAHGYDEWPVPSSRCYKSEVWEKQTRTFEERLQIAQHHLPNLSFDLKNLWTPLVTVPNSGDRLASSDYENICRPWPIAVQGIFKDPNGLTMKYVGKIVDCQLVVEDVMKWLDSLQD